ncbi:hypothetical protein [Aldersonia kunmingensis]|uniref:hypothetical protein n=1 Tax=Aldersonia kunmingensis TaxID=408066 RepID=UPI000836969B|nr:hypothetical protein [Aldersonia kunmingensis]
MKYELSPDAEKALDEQLEKSDTDTNDSGTDPLEQTLDVPKGGSEDDATDAVKKQYKAKSGLDLDDDVAREIARVPRDSEDDAKSGGDDKTNIAKSEAKSASDKDDTES